MSHEHHNATWTRLAKQTITQRPLCEDPFSWHLETGHYEPSTCVHHIESVKNAPHKVFDSSNLLALCSTCHDAIHGKSEAIKRLLSDGIGAAHAAQVIARGGSHSPQKEGIGAVNYFQSPLNDQMPESKGECE